MIVNGFNLFFIENGPNLASSIQHTSENTPKNVFEESILQDARHRIERSIQMYSQYATFSTKNVRTMEKNFR